jgi:hypothetical protein
MEICIKEISNAVSLPVTAECICPTLGRFLYINHPGTMMVDGRKDLHQAMRVGPDGMETCTKGDGEMENCMAMALRSKVGEVMETIGMMRMRWAGNSVSSHPA